MTTTLQQNWKNAHVLRTAGEYSGLSAWPIRFGYAFSTAVTPEEQALYSFVAPGPSHVFDFGMGHHIALNIELNAALEYSRAYGKVPAGTTTALSGGYKSDAWTCHIGFDIQV